MVAKLKGWPKGMDNIQPDFALKSDTLRQAVNVDVLNSGALRRRKGYTSRHAGRTHSLYAHEAIALFVEDGNLKRLLPDFTAVLLRAGVGDTPMQYDAEGSTIYYTNNAVNGRVIDGFAVPWGVELPATPPVATIVGGSLAAGTYQLVATFVAEDGEESGCGVPTRITLATPGGLAITLPQPTEPTVARVRLYLTPPDGDALYSVGTAIVGDTTMTLATPPLWGRELKTQYRSRLFPGEHVQLYKGRAYVAQGPVLWYSDPFAYGLLDPSTNFLAFAAPIDVLVAVENGLYVVADKTYFLKGTGPR
jgi:hypothetical protein